MSDHLPKRPRAQAPQAVEIPKPPKHLGEESSAQWVAIVGDWVLGADALPLLQAACESWDRYAVARDQLAKDGPTVTHPTSGAIVAHPAHSVARDNLREWRQLWRQIGLEPPK